MVVILLVSIQRQALDASFSILAKRFRVFCFTARIARSLTLLLTSGTDAEVPSLRSNVSRKDLTLGWLVKVDAMLQVGKEVFRVPSFVSNVVLGWRQWPLFPLCLVKNCPIRLPRTVESSCNDSAVGSWTATLFAIVRQPGRRCY